MAKRPFNRNVRYFPRNEKIPPNLGGKMLYFHNIPETSKFHTMNKAMVLVTEDDVHSRYVFGLVMNKNHHMRLHNYLFKSEETTLAEKFRLLTMAASGKEEFSLEHMDTISFLMPREGHFLERAEEGITDTIFPFKDYAFYSTESVEEAADLLKYAQPGDKFLMLFGQVVMEHEAVIYLLRSGCAVWRDPDPEVVFNPSAYMRGKLTFPEFYNGNEHRKPDPSP